jgi:SNF2 family DNA or RNA helicase
MKIRRNLRDGGLAIALSGTPFLSDLTNAWGTANWLNPKKFSGYWKWAETYFGVHEEQAGRRMVKVVGDGSKAPEPLDPVAFDRMLRPFYLARKKSEVAADLPPIIYAGTPPEDDPDGPCYVRLPMDDKQAKAYYQMKADAEADIEGGRIKATGILAETTRLRQFATSYCRRGEGRTVLPGLPSNKVEWIIDFMRERQDTGAKVVIASNFTEVVEMTADALRKEKWEVATLTGATSLKKRTQLQARFQDPGDPLRVFIINTKAGGESITLDAADEMIVIDDPWKSDTSKQLHDRIHRVSRVHQVTVYRLLSVGTIEEWMAGLTEEQRRVLETASPKKLSELVLEGVK